jgi:hypothetical protein
VFHEENESGNDLETTEESKIPQPEETAADVSNILGGSFTDKQWIMVFDKDNTGRFYWYDRYENRLSILRSNLYSSVRILTLNLKRLKTK